MLGVSVDFFLVLFLLRELGLRFEGRGEGREVGSDGG